MIKNEGGIKTPKKYNAKYDFQLTENIDVNIFDRDKKEIYFSIRFNLGTNPRGIVAWWKLWESKIIQNVLKKGLKIKRETKKRLSKDPENTNKDYFEQIEIHDVNRTFDMILMAKGNDFYSYHEVGISPVKIIIELPDYEAKKLLEDRTRIIKHAKIDRISDEEIISYEGRMEVSKVELLLSLSEIQYLIKLLEKIVNNELPESDEDVSKITENEWVLNYSKGCQCSECNSPTEDEYLLGINSEAVDVSYNKKEINELLWALKRLIKKYESEIKNIVATRGI